MAISFQTRWYALIALVLSSASTAQSDDWTQWRGPNRDGISAEKGLARAWPAEGPELKWRITTLGYGFGTPAVVEGVIYIVGNEGMDNEYVKAMSAEDGADLWTTRIGKVGKPDQRPSYPGARCTPAVVGESVHVLGSDGDLVCLDRKSGEVRWRKHLAEDFGGRSGNWAFSESPLVDGDIIAVTPAGGDATVVALDRKTGDLVWKTAVPGNEDAGYASLVSSEIGGVKQFVAFLGSGVAGLDAKSGTILWENDRINGGGQVTPVIDDGFVFTSANRKGGAVVQVSHENAGLKAEEVYFDNKLPSGSGGSVVIDDHLYGSGGNTFLCVDFRTGELVWEERSVNGASICSADGLLYLHGSNGEMALVEATPEGYREVGRFMPLDQPDRGRGGRAMTAPVIADGKLYVRDLEILWCYEAK